MSKVRLDLAEPEVETLKVVTLIDAPKKEPDQTQPASLDALKAKFNKKK